MIQEADGGSIQSQRLTTLLGKNGAFVPHRMRRAQEFQCTMVREDAFGPHRGRYQKGVRLVLLHRNSWWHHRIRLPGDSLEPPPRQVVLQPLNRSGPATGGIKGPHGFPEREDHVRREEIGCR